MTPHVIVICTSAQGPLHYPDFDYTFTPDKEAFWFVYLFFMRAFINLAHTQTCLFFQFAKYVGFRTAS